MNLNLKYKAWADEKHPDMASLLINTIIETFAIEFANWLYNENISIKQNNNNLPIKFKNGEIFSIGDITNEKLNICNNCEIKEATMNGQSIFFCGNLGDGSEKINIKKIIKTLYNERTRFN